jgi:hypothetical protein
MSMGMSASAITALSDTPSRAQKIANSIQKTKIKNCNDNKATFPRSSVVDPDPYVFGPPGSVSHKYG